VNLEIGPNMTGDLADLGWLAEPNHADKGGIARALTGLVERAMYLSGLRLAASEAA
jgi:hypothetical protein